MALLGAALTAAWLGLVTAVMPCPLAANIAAVSYIAKRISRARLAVLSGLMYAAGRSATYIAIAVVLTAGALTQAQVADFLQRYLNKALGPLLIVAGMFILDLSRFRAPSVGVSEKLQKRVERGGAWAAALLGVVLALSFCPPSAVVFFGTLIPLSIKHESRILLPLVYGISTGLPVAVFGVLIALGVKSTGAILDKVQAFERWARRVTGVVFLLVGIYYSLVYIFGVPLYW